MVDEKIKPHLNTLRVLFIAAEAEPFVKVGGLGDVAGSLPLALRAVPSESIDNFHIDARLVIPFHPLISLEKFQPEKVSSFSVQSRNGPVLAEVFQVNLQGMPVYLISGEPVQAAKSVYSQNTLQDGDKYVFFSKAVLEFCNQLDWKPDILHVNDWHTAIIPAILKSNRSRYPSLATVKTVLTIHNLPFMGAGIEDSLEKFQVPPSKDTSLPAWARHFPLPMGLAAADEVVAVSPHYASELFTEEFGCGLQSFFDSHASITKGILNGIDIQTWNPEKDPLSQNSFSPENLETRSVNRELLIKEFKLDANPEIPLLTYIGRMDIQKGISLLLDALSQMKYQNWQAIIIGTGSEELERKCRQLESSLPDRVRAVIRYDSALSHRLYAGADMIMIPSRYEPCGLVQMIAMRYGCVPVAHAVGGLVDTITDHPNKESTGFLFPDPSVESLQMALIRAIKSFTNKNQWKKIQLNGMKRDFSWNASAIAYANIYLNLRGEKE